MDNNTIGRLKNEILGLAVCYCVLTNWTIRRGDEMSKVTLCDLCNEKIEDSEEYSDTDYYILFLWHKWHWKHVHKIRKTICEECMYKIIKGVEANDTSR